MCTPCLEAALVDHHGLLVRRDHPKLRKVIDRAVAAGRLARLTRGVYCTAGSQEDVSLRVRAALALEPAAVITGRAAAALSWWKELKVPVVDVSLPRGPRLVDAAGIRWHRGAVPPELVQEEEGIRIVTPALSVLELIPELGGNAIDEALRRRAATLAQLNDALALTPGRPGNVQRRWLLDDSRDEPWSEAERSLHRGFRALRLPYAFRTNHRVALNDGTTHPIDLALPELLLGFEVDGYAFHRSREAFERDRRLERGLAALSWQIVRLSATGVMEDPETFPLIRASVEARAALMAGPGRSRRRVPNSTPDSRWVRP